MTVVVQAKMTSKDEYELAFLAETALADAIDRQMEVFCEDSDNA